MSSRKQAKMIKRHSHDQIDNIKDKKKLLNLSLCEVESKSSSCGSRRSHKKLSSLKKDRDNFFIVDKIVGHKIQQGKSYFKVQWQGYDESEDSWEPEENLGNVLDLIEEYKTGKPSDSKSEDNSRSVGSCNRSRNIGCYDYVPSNKIVAVKTKYFDDVRDGKIDLTKNDLYSRVKTRKRLFLEEHSAEKPGESPSETRIANEDLMEISAEQQSKPEDVVVIGYEKSKFYQTNLFEMTAEFIKSEGFKKSQHNTIASKSSSNDDISLFNYSISPHTNQSDEFPVQISPVHQSAAVEPGRVSVYTQTSVSMDCPCKMEAEIKIAEPIESSLVDVVKPQLQRIIDKIEQTFERSSTPQRLVTNETHLLSIYASELRHAGANAINLPAIQSESELVSVDSFSDLRCAILMDKYQLLHSALLRGTIFDWRRRFMPEGVTPLQLAVTKNRVNIVRLLLRYGACADGESDAPVDGALGDNPSVDGEENISGDAGDSDTDSPLILAARHGHVHTAKALIDHGAFIDRRGAHNRTALCAAIENGRVDVADLLLRCGTNFYRIADGLSSTALIHALASSSALSAAVCADLLGLVCDYHMGFVSALNRTVARYLCKHNVAVANSNGGANNGNTSANDNGGGACTIFPHQWVSVRERRFHTEFVLDGAALAAMGTPLLLLAHGVQADCARFHLWLGNDRCCVEAVTLNGHRQTALSTGAAAFACTLWPLRACSNSLSVLFTDTALLTLQEKHIRVAVVAVSVDIGSAAVARGGGGGGGHNVSNISKTTALSQHSTHSRHCH